MTASRLRLVLTAIGILGGLGSLIVLATELGVTINVIDATAARQQALADVSRLRLQPGSPQSRADAEGTQATVSSLLALSPTDSELWVIQGRLAASLRAADQRVADMLKMSYLTAPNNFALMPGRLEIAMTTRALSDPVLEVLAEGDVRAILLKRKELAGQLLESYQRAAEPGRTFLVRAAAASDPEFAARLPARRR